MHWHFIKHSHLEDYGVEAILISISYSQTLFEDKIGSLHPEKEQTLKKKTISWVVSAIVLLGLLIQFVPLPGRGNNPAVVAEPKWDSPQTRALVKRSCFDCHSDESRWPLYSYVAPVSWLIYNDVMQGRFRLNFSEWNRPQRGAGEIVAAIQEGEMPPAIYTPLHPDAQLTSAEKQQMIDGLTKSLP